MMLIAAPVLPVKTACFFPIQSVCQPVLMAHTWQLQNAAKIATTNATTALEEKRKSAQNAYQSTFY